MSIQDLGDIGELLSAIAVLITLVYLAIQVRETRLQAITQTNFQSAQALRDELMVFMDPRVLRSGLLKAYESREALAPDEELAMDAWMQC